MPLYDGSPTGSTPRERGEKKKITFLPVFCSNHTRYYALCNVRLCKSTS